MIKQQLQKENKKIPALRSGFFFFMKNYYYLRLS